jgi:hypothetical protein
MIALAFLPWILFLMAIPALLFYVLTGIPFLVWYIAFVGTGVYLGIKKAKDKKEKDALPK